MAGTDCTYSTPIAETNEAEREAGRKVHAFAEAFTQYWGALAEADRAAIQAFVTQIQGALDGLTAEARARALAYARGEREVAR